MSIQNIGIGLVANDGLGDSIRDAFRKTNENFAYLDTLTQNLTTGDLTASGQITLNATTASYWTGVIYLNGSRVATTDSRFEGGRVPGVTYFDSATPSTSTTTGAVILTAGGLGVAAASNFGDLTAGNINVTYDFVTSTLSSDTGAFTGAVSTADLGVTGVVISTGNIFAGNCSAITDNRTKRNVAAYFGYFQELSGTLQTAAQPNITSLGTLTALNLTGAMAITGTQTTTGIGKVGGNLVAYSETASTTTTTGALVVRGGAGVTGAMNVGGNVASKNVSAEIGAFANATVQTVPSNYHVTNKSYVNNTVIGFAIGLGS